MDLANPIVLAAVIQATGSILAALVAGVLHFWGVTRAARVQVAGRNPQGSATLPRTVASARWPALRRAALIAYVLSVAAAGVAVLSWFYWDLKDLQAPTTLAAGRQLLESSVSWSTSPGLLILCWFGMSLALSLLPRALPGGGKTSVVWVLDFSAVLLFGPASAGLLVGATNILSNVRRGFVRSSFNFFQIVLTVTACAATYRWAGGRFGESITVDSIESFRALLCAAVAYFVVNSALVATALSLDQGISLRHAWRRNFERQIPDVILVLLPLGTALALVQVSFGLPGVLITSLIVLQLHRAYQGDTTSPDRLLRTLRAFANEVDRSHDGTAHHSVRLAAYSVRVAWEFPVSAREAHDLEVAALLHNPTSITMRRIITKSGALSERERERLEAHPEIAYELLRSLPGLAGAAAILLWHHERPDGHGFPKGTVNGIPRAARILAAVDAFDAMVHRRPYRQPMTVEEAYEELERMAGTQFDPKVVRAIIRLDRQGVLDDEYRKFLETFPRTRDPRRTRTKSGQIVMLPPDRARRGAGRAGAPRDARADDPEAPAEQ